MANPIHAVIGSAASQIAQIATPPPSTAVSAQPPGAQVIQVQQAAAIVSISSESKKDAPNIEKRVDAKFGSEASDSEGGQGGGGGSDDDGSETDEQEATDNPDTALPKPRLDVSA